MLWLDETKIEFFGQQHWHILCQIRDGYKEKHLLPTLKYDGGSVMLLGCFAASGPGALVKINGIMNSAKSTRTS